MYAIVEIAGQQFKVEAGRRVYVNRLNAKEGEKITFDKVLLTQNGEEVKVGTPVVDGAVVSATVLEHMKGDKVLVFKKKRRKGYQKLNGHRQLLTQILVDGISADGKEVAEKEKPAVEESTVKETTETTIENDSAVETK